MVNERRTRLRAVTSALLDPAGTYSSWRDAAVALYDLCSEIAPLPANEMPSSDHEATTLPVGKAISPVDAARCVLDFERTRKLVAGLARAIRDVGDRPVHVLYAGTGPFAPLVVPLTTLFGPDELRFTLLDVHPSSIERLHAIVGAFELGPYVEAVVEADATEHDPSSGAPVDVLVVEAMQRALSREPQVAIVRNLLRRLPASVRLVPEEVLVSARFAVPGATAPSLARPPDRALGEVLRLDAAWARAAVGDVLPCAALPVVVAPHPDQVLTLDTRLKVGDGLEIGQAASGLTMPLHMIDVAIDRSPCVLDFEYRIGHDPGLTCAVV